MKTIFLMLVFTLIAVSCATPHSSSSVLYQEYSQYQENANKNNIIEVASNFFSSSLLGNSYRSSPEAINQLLFNRYMVTTASHHEKINGPGGCLTINGYDEENAPLIFSLKYISRDGHWLIDKIHVVFIENDKYFADNPKCPSEYTNDAHLRDSIKNHLTNKEGVNFNTKQASGMIPANQRTWKTNNQRV